MKKIVSLACCLTILLSVNVLAEVKTKVVGDFHMTLYQGSYGEISDFQLFTKLADKEVYFGVSCSNRTPFPLLQVLLFNENKWMTDSAVLHVNYGFLSNELAELEPGLVPLKGTLSSVKKAKKDMNNIRLEVDTARIKSMRALQVVYTQFLKQLKSESMIYIQLIHRDFGKREYHFSLEGLSALLEPYESVCR
ncbi:MAG: hypothetical protein ISEC1_P0883 [Thiomicrorhabdus sp.]|nr:MAG: hypothetical protein ISEC1_P0883 [Thiomicrorhabdus sp.]